MKFKISSFILFSLMFSGCLGYSSKNNELVGQVKKIIKRTPVICSERVEVDLSLGIMKNGVGSMSQEDVWLNVTDPKHMDILKKAQELGQPVKVNYDSQRMVNLCAMYSRYITKVEISK